jgi:hypothetical protein
MFVWGNNSNSELGLSNELVEDNRESYIKTKKKAYLNSPVYHYDFNSIVHQVAPGNTSTTVLCVEPETKETYIVLMGQTMFLEE